METSDRSGPNFQLLFESVPGLYLILDSNLKIAAVSNAYLAATLTKRSEILGRGIFEVFPDNPDDPNADGVSNLKESLLRVISTKAPDAMAVQKYDIQLPESEGGGFREKFWSPLNTPILGENGKVAYIVHQVEDVTEFVQLNRKRSEEIKITEELRNRTRQMESEILRRSEQLQQTNRKLREAEQIKNEFFANVSHELRTPLALILAPLESILSGKYGDIPAQQSDFLKTIHNNSIRLLQLVNSILDFSKVESGKMTVELESLDIAKLTSSILKDFIPSTHEKGITIRSEIKPESIGVRIDRYLFERILFNLLSNAIKFTPSSGNITVSLILNDNMLTLSVSDSGIGISEEDIPKLFRSFHQLEGSSTRRFEGTGLGLAMVKEFSELLGGEVDVKSRIGFGSTFTVKIPVQTSGSSDLIEAAPRSTSLYYFQTPKKESVEHGGSSSSSARVLVCEDNPDLSDYISSLLKDFCTVMSAKNGEEGIALVRSWSPDLVLSDVMMPVKDGIELCREIKSDPDLSKTVVILLTAQTHRDAMIRGWEAKADEYLFKPFHPEELITRVKSLLSIAEDRKRTIQWIEQKNAELADANSELEAFSYSVSHDLRAPLRAIYGYSEMLREDYGSVLDEDGNRFLKVLTESTQRMERLIDNLLEFSRVGKKESHNVRFDMTEIANNVVSQLKEQAEVKAEIVIHPLSEVISDKDLMSYVFQNLISNAVKYSSKKEHPKVEVGMTDTERGKTFFVKDNGAGFDMKYYSRLFGVFQRLHRQDDFDGTGVGLAIVNRIVTRYKGKVWAEGKIGEGACFYFTIGDPPGTEAGDQSEEVA
ncbi:response regulator [Leptospira wolffii]|uniref:hybrid sensor histidine kinase/response regulator n=1 Tax=Leptospira wolffii TaxID=409998 RepID=UPI001082B155|nr:ATP-binding protein [Leptospira wolffii]TGL47409.1 response regulator [Leptospira wolffii]